MSDTKFGLPEPIVADDALQLNFQALINAVNALARFVDYGTGVPAHTPVSARFYIRHDPAPGAAIYGWNGTAWTAIA